MIEDGAFAPPSEPIDVKAVFALSPEMRHFLDTSIRRSVMTSGLRNGLVDATQL